MRYTVANVTGLELGAASVTGIDTTDETRLTAEKIALATGLWTGKLMSSAEGALGIAKQGRIERQASAAGVAVAHYKMFPAEMEQFSEMPVVVNGGRGGLIPPPKANPLPKYTNANILMNHKFRPYDLGTPGKRSAHRLSQIEARNGRVNDFQSHPKLPGRQISSLLAALLGRSNTDPILATAQASTSSAFESVFGNGRQLLQLQIPSHCQQAHGQCHHGS